MAAEPTPPRDPAGWRLYGLLALLALIAVLLLFRGCGQEAEAGPVVAPVEPPMTVSSSD